MTKAKPHRTDFLYPTPDFITGAGSVINIAGNYFTFNYSESDHEADCRAIRSDWEVIGHDITEAITDLQSDLVK